MSKIDTSTPIITGEGIRKEYSSPGGKLVVLDGVDIRVAKGESLAIMGPSGSGKSTLLYILGTLETMTSGRVLLHGSDPFALGQREMADFRSRQIGFIFQDHHLLPQCTALENVMVPTLASKTAIQKDAIPHAKRLLEQVGLAARAGHFPSDLSGGERQRVAIARALINRPGIILCDEPTGDLDEESGELIGQCLLSLQHEEDVALVVVTHNLRFGQKFGRVMDLKLGKLEQRQ